MAQSNVCAMLERGADEAEAAQALLEMSGPTRRALIEALDEAQHGVAAEMFPLVDLPDQTLERFISQEIAGFIRLTGGGWPPEQRQEFIDQCVIEFADVPAAILQPVIAQARRTVFDPKRFVSWIFEAIGPKLERLAAERERIEALQRLMQGV